VIQPSSHNDMGLLDRIKFLYLLVEYSFMPRKFVFSLGHELLLRHCEVCTALFATIVNDVLALGFH